MNDAHPSVNDGKLHEEAITSLVAETGFPADVVRGVYERELDYLSANAKVKGFLVLFAVRRTRAALRASPPALV